MLDIDFLLAFDSANVRNDFALLHLADEFDLSDPAKINTICLPSSKRAQDYDQEGCFATGWGKDSPGAFGIWGHIHRGTYANSKIFGVT